LQELNIALSSPQAQKPKGTCSIKWMFSDLWDSPETGIATANWC